jgi:outer membrane murein-binding lipoprotein Lpp
MTDVVEIANERSDALAAEIDKLAAEIDKLAAEIAKLDDFIRMAEALLKHSQSKSNKASDTEDEMAAGGNGADAEHEDLSVRELKAEELVRKSRTAHNEPALDRREHFHFEKTA